MLVEFLMTLEERVFCAGSRLLCLFFLCCIGIVVFFLLMCVLASNDPDFNSWSNWLAVFTFIFLICLFFLF